MARTTTHTPGNPRTPAAQPGKTPAKAEDPGRPASTKPMFVRPSTAGAANASGKRDGGSAPATEPGATPKASARVEGKTEYQQQPPREAVAQAAYFLWMERGGDETTNWLEAEAALRRARR